MLIIVISNINLLHTIMYFLYLEIVLRMKKLVCI